MTASGGGWAARLGYRPAPIDADLPAVRRISATALLLVGAGGAAGVAARYGVGRIVDVAPTGFPWATFGVNVAGSLALGLLLGWLLRRQPGERLRLLLGTGFLGSFTTWSTFVTEADLLVTADRLSLALLYVASSVAAGLAAAGAGLRLSGGRR